jgi:hypothetical protein
MISCGWCGRPIGPGANSGAGRCKRDRYFLCYRCTTTNRRCPKCEGRTSDPAGAILSIGVFMTILFGLVFLGLFLPDTLTNIHLDSLPVTPTSGVTPGGTFKVYATVAPNQSDVVVGRWSGTGGGGTWGWTAHNFWLEENGIRLFVNVSGLLNVRQPGSPWGSQAGTVIYTAGTAMAAYGPARSSANGTTLFVQYIAQSPGAMGHVAGDLWPLTVGLEVGMGIVSAAAAGWHYRQLRAHRKALSTSPPQVDPPVPVPRSRLGSMREYPNPLAERRFRNSRWGLVGSALLIAFGGLILPLSVVASIFPLLMGLVIFFISWTNRAIAARGISAVVSDDSGMYLRAVTPSTESLDPYIPWENVRDYYVANNRLLLLRTTRGEVPLPGLDAGLVKGVVDNLRLHGVQIGTSSSPMPLRPSHPSATLSLRDRLTVQRRVFAYSILVGVTTLAALLSGPAGFLELALSPALGEALLAIAIASTLVALLLSSRITILNWRVSERVRATGL